MSYHIFMRFSMFTIKSDRAGAALAALRIAHPTALRDATDLDDALESLGWSIEFNKSGDVHTIDIIGDRYHAHEEPLIAIAAFVEHDSYIEMQGEGGEVWRWEFRDGRLYEMEAVISWKQVAVWSKEKIAG